MSNRWHMNRMGFVNFWLYDEEIFSFSDGRLLLRGQNASGKSITTQSFIPFILDGDRTPSRLDPFGSTDRKMDYYFLGEGGKEESTGYLFLEFKRENVDQYRTIGIGQRAQKGKPMTFWGFVMLDGRRIGYDLELYREAGSKKIPFTKQELKEILGESNPYTEAQREYMGLVNKYIFGFASLEQYNQFIKLLIKVRAPKLSKEFKPSKVYEILEDSLQTLSDEDMRAMVEAMENMDDIQNRLENLKSAFNDAKIIRNEYLRYNLYMLGKKAQVYLEEKKNVEGLREKLERREEEQERKKQERLEREETAGKLREEEDILVKEKGTLQAEDLEVAVERLQEAQKTWEEAQKRKAGLEAKIERTREQILLYDGRLREHRGQVESYQDEVKNHSRELEEGNDLLQLEMHSRVQDILYSANRSYAIQELDQGVRGLEKAVREGYDALRQQQELQEKWDREEEKLQKLLMEKERAESQCRDAEILENECRDKLIEQFYILAAENQEMAIVSADQDQMALAVQGYQGPGDFAGIRDLFYCIWKEKNESLAEERMAVRNQKEIRRKERQRLTAELEDIRKMEMPVPKHSPRTEAARKRLKEKGIPFLPFFEAVEFAEELGQDIRNRIECQLLDAGLLDALIIPEKEYQQAWEELRELSDICIHPEGPGGSRYPYLKAADMEPGFREETERILEHIYGTSQQESILVLGDDGYFKHGILEGFSHGEEEASYIGAEARNRKKERMLKQKEEELRLLEEQIARLELELTGLDTRILKLKLEYDRFPSFTDLDQAIDLLRSSRLELEKNRDLWEAQELETTRAHGEYKKSEQKVIKICKPLPYMRKQNVYQEVLEAAETYREDLHKLERSLSCLDNEKSRCSSVEELIQKAEESRDSDYDYLRDAQKSIRESEVQIASLNAYLDNPQIKEMAERLKKIKERLGEIAGLFQENGNVLAVLRDNIARLTGEIKELKEEVTEQIGRESTARKYFMEELSLGLVMRQEGDSVYEAAIKAQSLIREGDRLRSGIEMTTSLMRTFQARLGTLSSYGTTMEECFGNEGGDSSLLRSRQRIASIWNGQKLYLEEFYAVLKDSIESTELLIQQKDRELFEGILADTLSRKLSYRIRESRSWIKDMSELMKGMDTSMALTFSLDWKPRAAEGENELDTQELEKILARERELLTDEDIEKVSLHFRNKIQAAKQNAEENKEAVNYMDLVRDALDYRKWFQFRMNFYRNNENRKELTNGAFNRFSGGEKAMAMYVPLFAAVNAQYKKAGSEDHPRMIALDEAFAGVDDKNISSMFELVQKLDFDYIMNSQVLWGCYETVKSLRIAELLRPANTEIVTVIYYHWNGRERILDEQ